MNKPVKATHVIAHIFKVRALLIGVLQRTMHLFKRLGGVVSCNTLRLNVIKQMPDKVHFGEVPIPRAVFLVFV